jgi:hypothetical protein
MADDLMVLVKELKGLNKRKKAGEALSPEEDKRRKKLKKYLKSALAKDKGDGGGGATAEGSAVSGLDSSMMMTGESTPPTPAPTPPKKEYKNAFAIDAGGLMESAAASTEGPSLGGPDDREDFSVEDDELAELEQKTAEPPKKKDYSNAFAIDAGALFEEANQSDVVAAAAPEKVAGPGGSSGAKPKLGEMDFDGWLKEMGDERGPRNDQNKLRRIAAEADKAVAENKKRERVTDPDAVKNQLADIFSQSSYTPPEKNISLEQYYGGYSADEGMAYAELQEAYELNVIDPRELELHRAGLISEEGETAAPVPGGLAFLDDFPALYAMGIIPPADDEVAIDSDDPNLIIPGRRKVTVHMLNGQTKRGVIRTFSRGDMGFRLEPQGAGRSEDIALQQIKAIFVHLPSKAEPKEIHGQNVTVQFQDRRSVKGMTDDYQAGVPVFTLIPPVGRGGRAQFERIIINAAAVKSVR